MEKCCNSCAFLECNRGKPTPTNHKNKTDTREWYAQTTIDEIWNDVKESGMFLTCHSTDPTYYAQDGKKPLMACMGVVVAIFMHIKIFEHLGGKWGAYKKAVGNKVAMDRRAAFEAALSMAMGHGDLTGKFLIPRTFSMDTDALRFPTGFEKTVTYFKENILPTLS